MLFCNFSLTSLKICSLFFFVGQSCFIVYFRAKIVFRFYLSLAHITTTTATTTTATTHNNFIEKTLFVFCRLAATLEKSVTTTKHKYFAKYFWDVKICRNEISKK